MNFSKKTSVQQRTVSYTPERQAPHKTFPWTVHILKNATVRADNVELAP